MGNPKCFLFARYNPTSSFHLIIETFKSHHLSSTTGIIHYAFLLARTLSLAAFLLTDVCRRCTALFAFNRQPEIKILLRYNCAVTDFKYINIALACHLLYICIHSFYIKDPNIQQFHLKTNIGNLICSKRFIVVL